MGWGVDGGNLQFGIRCNGSTTRISHNHYGGCQGGNTQIHYLRADAIIKSVKKGERLEFDRINLTGSFGSSQRREWSAICFPE